MNGESKTGLVSLERITVIDALRGFALLGVLLMHMLDHFGYFDGNITVNSSVPELDKLMHWFSSIFIRGKFMSIFSFLFGLSFYIQMERASKKGIDFRGRFLWRMLLLFVIGMIGTSFTYVDILTIYAVFGVVLVFLYPLRNWVLMLIISLLLLGVPNLFIIGFDKVTIEQATEDISPSLSEQSAMEDVQITEEQYSGMNAFESKTFLETAKENLTVKTFDKLKHQFVYGGNGYLILGLFIIGFMVGRVHFFEQVYIRKKRSFVLLALFLLISLFTLIIIKIINPAKDVDLFRLMAEGRDVPLIYFAVSFFKNLNTIGMAGVLVMGFVILYQIGGVRKYLDMLTPYGRMGLTNYEMQNIIGAILFSAWGFGAFFGSKGITGLFALGLIIYTLQIIISKYWMKQFLYGPFEWLWRSGTYLKFPPFKRKKDTNMIDKKNNHVTFREYSHEVLDKSWEWLNDPEIKELTLTPDFDRESQQIWFQSLPGKGNYYIRSIWWNEEPIGAFGIKNITGTDGEVWYYIGEKKYWGKGIGSQMMQYLIEYAGSQKLKSVYAKLHKTNTGSYKLCEKFGFKEEKEIDNTIIVMTRNVYRD